MWPTFGTVMGCLRTFSKCNLFLNSNGVFVMVPKTPVPQSVMNENLDQNSKVFAEILKNCLFSRINVKNFKNLISFDFQFFRIVS